MKKTLTLILSLILLVCTCVSFSACKKSNDVDLRDGLVEKLMVDFETVNELMSVNLLAHETKITHNADKNFVSHGEKSMKIHLNHAQSAIGYYEDTILQFIPGQQYFNHTDFSDVVGLSVDIWNDNGFDVEMCFSLNNKAVVIDYMTLKPGYNKVEFLYDHNQVISFTDKQLVSLDFSFYSKYGNEVLYIDNVNLIVTEEEYTPYDYTAVYKKDIIFGYEDFAESIAIIDLGGYDSMFSRARTTINADRRYITQGNGSLKVDFYRSPKDEQVDNTVIRTYDNIMADFNAYKEGDWALAVDVFNDNENVIDFELKIFSTTDDETCSVNVKILPNSWSDRTQLKMPISQIEEAFMNEQIKVLTIVYGFNGISAGDTVYIDNLRFERGTAQ